MVRILILGVLHALWCVRKIFFIEFGLYFAPIMIQRKQVKNFTSESIMIQSFSGVTDGGVGGANAPLKAQMWASF